MVDGLIESTHFLRNPLDVLAQQIVAHVAAVDECSVDEVAELVRGCANFAQISDELLDQRARPAVGALSERGVLRAPPAPRVGPRERSTPRPRRVEAAGRHLRRHDPRSRPVRRVPPRRHAGRRARRGDGLRVAPGRDVRARGLHVAHRGHHVRARHGQPGAGPTRQDAVLARRSSRPPVGVGPRARRVRARDPRPRSGRRDRAALHALLARCVRGEQPRAVPRRTGRGDGRRARRPHDRRRALPRRDRRLAGVHPQPVRHARPRAVGDGDRTPAGRPVRPAGRVDVGRRRHRHPAARVGRRTAARGVRDRPRRHRRARRVDAAADGAVLVPLPRVRRPGAAAAAPPARPAHPAVAAASAGRRSAGGGVEVPDVPDPARGVARVPAGRVRRAGPARGARPVAVAGDPGRERRHRVGQPDGVEPAVQLDRGVHVRGRCAAGRAARRGAGARP